MRRQALVVLWLGLAGWGTGCSEAEPVPVRVELAGCLGEAQGEGSCRANLDGMTADAPGGACLVLQLDGDEPVRLAYDWEAGAAQPFRARSAAELPFRDGASVSGALFLFDASGADDPCQGGSLAATADCTETSGCVLRVVQPARAMTKNGLSLDFGAADGACNRQAGASLAAVAERCDGADNNCDGQVDEGFALGEPCRTEAGVCGQGGVNVCGDDGALVCTPGDGEPVVGPSDEICDTLDNDCDGLVDEGVLDCCQEGETRACGRDAPPCTAGTQTCEAVSGADGLVTFAYGGCLLADGTAAVLEAPEACDGVDNDCDGATDEDFTLTVPGAAPEERPVGAECPIGDGVCQVLGQVGCEGGAPVCVGGEPNQAASGPEVCDGLDNDCDGLADEGVAGEACMVGVGACQATGRRICDADGELFCANDQGQPLMPRAPAVEACTSDGGTPADEDCDGRTDEGFDELGDQCPLGLGICARPGALTCVGGALECVGEVVPPQAEVCNGLDDNCDGAVDEPFDLQVDVQNCGECGVDCTRPNANAACQAGVCALGACVPPFEDRDGDPENGCECDPGAEDLPDPLFIDLNCDGVDGQLNRAIFVSPTGQDEAPATGNRDAPLRTLAKAIELSAPNNPPRPIYLAVGEYDVLAGPSVPADAAELGLRVPSGLSIHGGYDPANGWQRLGRERGQTVITGNHVVLRYQGVESATWLDNLVVQATDAPQDKSSVGVIAIEVAENVVLRDVTIASGRGGQGRPGLEGRNGGDDGRGDVQARAPNGGAGSPGTASMQVPDPSAGGRGATNLVCPAATEGGRGGDGAIDAAAADGAVGAGDRGGAAGSGEGGNDGAGSSGGAGVDGAHGGNGVAGVQEGRIDEATAVWVPRGSVGGRPAESGGGGGGGGGAQGRGQTNGRGGGGGGAGGCAGEAGRPGLGGGGSFAVTIMGGILRFQNVRLLPGRGGTGGDGGSGGVGQLGGLGGASTEDGSCPGCPAGGQGGPGGRGGCGGNAGGAGGGPSFALFRINPERGDIRALSQSNARLEDYDGRVVNDPVVEAGTYSPGEPGAGGDGGNAAGRQEAQQRGIQCGEPAPDGDAGQSGAIGCCRFGPGAAGCGVDLAQCEGN